MEKEFKVSKAQIEVAHRAACDEWKKRLEEWFPKAFVTTEYIKGYWYLIDSGAVDKQAALVQYRGKDKRAVGFNYVGEWTKSFGGTYTWENTQHKNVTSSPHLQEVIRAEASLRGFSEAFLLDNGTVWDREQGKGGNCLLDHLGDWRKNINYLTVAEAEAKFQIKIKQ